ncbi:hypothetical protein, partial [Paraburkholderia guartelaensis]|uniref:hypothetical protein n=1 Tax=Paraburkholderia guartelaensis TaxID=2546446 RepID=UPI002AB71F62
MPASWSPKGDSERRSPSYQKPGSLNVRKNPFIEAIPNRTKSRRNSKFWRGKVDSTCRNVQPKRSGAPPGLNPMSTTAWITGRQPFLRLFANRNVQRATRLLAIGFRDLIKKLS